MAKMLLFYVPDDRQLLAALGEVTLRHEHLNHILKMTIKTLAEVSPLEAVDATQYEGSSTLRDRVKRLARQVLGEGQPLIKLQALLTRARGLTEQRNELTHGLWAKEVDGDPGIMGAPGELRRPLSLPDLEGLAQEIASLTEELNRARLEGFLKVALEKKRGKKG